MEQELGKRRYFDPALVAYDYGSIGMKDELFSGWRKGLPKNQKACSM
jgi:hypothetical protein